MKNSLMFKIILCALCFIGIICIWFFLNYISHGNATGIGLGDFILMLIGMHTLSNTFCDEIFKK